MIRRPSSRFEKYVAASVCHMHQWPGTTFSFPSYYSASIILYDLTIKCQKLICKTMFEMQTGWRPCPAQKIWIPHPHLGRPRQREPSGMPAGPPHHETWKYCQDTTVILPLQPLWVNAVASCDAATAPTLCDRQDGMHARKWNLAGRRLSPRG